MKTIFASICIFITCGSIAQNKQILYDFADMPQTLQLNPSKKTNSTYHLGIPALSGFSLKAGVTGVTVSDLFSIDSQDFSEKLGNVIDNLTNKDFFSLSAQLEFFNAGFRLDKRNYISFGAYQEVDFIVYFPKEILELLYKGNAPFLNKPFYLSQLKMRGELVTVYHVGLSRKINERLTLGGRLKLYGSNFHVQSTANKGFFRTVEAEKNIYKYSLENARVAIYSAGFFKRDSSEVSPREVMDASLLKGNIGAGIDIGFTYQHTPQMVFSGSILDIGMIHHSKNIRNATIKGAYTFEGIEITNTTTSATGWNQLDTDFEEKVPLEENTNSYTSWRPIKLYASGRYNFGLERVNTSCCEQDKYREYYKNSLGLQLYSITRPIFRQLAVTAFFEKNIKEIFRAKLTYTMDHYSLSSVGAGISVKMGAFHVYGAVDNIVRLVDLTTANSVSLQFGFYLLFGKKHAP